MAIKKKPIGIVVRRGALRRFDMLKRKSADLPVVISWDRRQTERRGAVESNVGNRRTSDRRQTPPSTWDLADFVVVEETPEAVPAAEVDLDRDVEDCRSRAAVRAKR